MKSPTPKPFEENWYICDIFSIETVFMIITALVKLLTTIKAMMTTFD